MDISMQEIAVRMIVITLLSGIIGAEREIRKKPAGVRTSALVGLGSTIMTMCGVFIASTYPGADPARIASIVVQGIGFIGAGVIIQSSGGEVHGITTAASMWLVAGLGIAVGFGFYYLAFLAALIALVMVVIFEPIEARLLLIEKERSCNGGKGGWFDKKP